VSKENWKKKKDSLLLHLSNYYEYEIKYSETDHRKNDYHIIKKIKDYEPPLGKKASQNIIYSKKIIEVVENDNLQTPKNVSRIIKDHDEIKALHHKEGTVYEYTRVNMRAMFGKYVNEGGSIGIITQKIWCCLDPLSRMVYLPMKEDEIDFLYKRFYDYKKEFKKDELSIISEYENGILTKSEMKEMISENSLSCFLSAKADFYKEYKFFPVKVPLYEFSAFPTRETETLQENTTDISRKPSMEEYDF
jgi:hypothetical protein